LIDKHGTKDTFTYHVDNNKDFFNFDIWRWENVIPDDAKRIIARDLNKHIGEITVIDGCALVIFGKAILDFKAAKGGWVTLSASALMALTSSMMKSAEWHEAYLNEMIDHFYEMYPDGYPQLFTAAEFEKNKKIDKAFGKAFVYTTFCSDPAVTGHFMPAGYRLNSDGCMTLPEDAPTNTIKIGK